MSQPQWKLVYATDYSALYIDETGVHDPELQIADEYETERGTTRWYVFRFSLERCYQVTRDGSTFLTDMDPAREHELPNPLASYVPWFASDLPDIARSVDSTIADLTEALCSEDPGTRAEAYEAIGGYHGWINFDQYPSDWTESEFSDWPERGRMRISISTNDDNDGLVTLYCDDQEAARDDRSVCGSNWETPGDMDVAYASVTDHPGLLAELEKEYEVDSSEYSPPSAEDLARWEAKYKVEGGQ